MIEQLRIDFGQIGDKQVHQVFEQLNKDLNKAEKEILGMDKAWKNVSVGGGKSIDFLNNKLKTLGQMKNAAFDERQIKKYNAEIQKTQAELSRLNGLGMSKKGGGGFGGGIETMLGGIPGAGMLMSAGPYALGAAAIGGGINLGIDSFKEANQTDIGMAKINATAKLTKGELEELEDKLFDMAKDNRVLFDKVPEGLEVILSANGNLVESLDILETSLKSAKSGFTDVKVVGEGLAQVLSIVGKENTNAAEIADVFFAAKDFGKGEFGDFSKFLPRLIAQSNNLGVSFKETAGAYAFLTKKFSAEDSSTLLNNVFVNLSDTKKSTNLKKVLGVEMFDSSGNIKDFALLMEEINRSLDGLTDEQRLAKLDKVGFDAQASQGVSALAGGYKELAQGIYETTHAQGSLEDAMKFTVTGSENIADLNNNWKRLKNTIGEDIAPSVNHYINSLNELFELEPNFASLEKAMTRVFHLDVPTNWINSNITNPLIGGAFELVNGPAKTKGPYDDLKAQLPMIKKMFDANPMQVRSKLNMDDSEILAWKKKFTENPLAIKAALNIDDATYSNIMEKFDALGLGKKSLDKRKNANGDKNNANIDKVKSELGKTSSSINDGGRQHQNLYVTIQRLAHIENINTTTAGQGIADIRQQLNEELTRVVRDVEITGRAY